MSKSEQGIEEGVGRKILRRYWVTFRCSHVAADVMRQIQSDVASLSPKALANFEKEKGRPWLLTVGDEFSIKIFGPWNGDVRVTEVSDASFSLVTLEGHPEAGHITFAIESSDATESQYDHTFSISSEARSRDRAVSLLYDTLAVGKFVQKQAWVQFCKNVVEACGGNSKEGVKEETRYIESGNS